MFIDVHCHLDYFSDAKIEEIIKESKKKKVGIVVSNGTNRETNLRNLKIAGEYEEVKVALGIYPIEALKFSDKEIEEEIEFIKKNEDKISAIGEVGLDYKESNEKERQIKIFEKFILLALKLNKPLIIHSRKAEQDCVEILKNINAKKVLMHCFSGKMKLVEKIVSNGWFLSIPANVKFSSHFQEIVKKIPIENLLCETDSPFLHPDKEQNNIPANVIESYKKIAEIKNLNIKEVEKLVEKNYLKLFNA